MLILYSIRDGKTSVVPYRTPSWLLFLKITKVCFIFFNKKKNHYRTCSLHFRYWAELAYSVRFTSLLPQVEK
jgi:hypothetical protein